MNKVFFERKKNSKRILLKFKFNKKIQETIKKVDRSSFYNKEMGCWEGDAHKLKNFVDEFKSNNIYFLLTQKMADFLGINVNGRTIDEIQKEKKWLSIHPSNALDYDNFNSLNINIRNGYSLYGYQKAGIKYIIDKNGRALLADEMGLGKTVQAILASKFFFRDWPVVVIAPSSLLYNWKKEFLQWLPDLKEEDITIITESKENPSSLITIASYDYVVKKSHLLHEYIGIRGVLIVDESHNVKNIDANRTKAIISLAHASLRCIFISGTPILNTPIEIFTQANALYPNIFPDYETFAFRYCDAQWTKYGLDISGASNLEELHHILRDNMMVRRLKNDVLTQLPEKRRSTIYIDVSDNENSTLLYELNSNLRTIIKDKLFATNFNLLETKKELLSYKKNGEKSDCESMALEAYRLSGLAKLPYIKEWITDKINVEMDKLIIFGHHKEFLSGIEEIVKELGLGYIKIDGSTDKKDRFEYVEQFQTDQFIQVAILSINAASVGLTLTSSSNIFMGEIPFTSGIALQAEDRIHRNGQEEKCNIYYGIGNNSVDPALWNNLLRKNEITNIALDGGFGTTMDEDFELSNGLLETLIIDVLEEIKLNS